MDVVLTPIHYYDTQLRRNLCGHAGFEQRSTKHSRHVTCQACIGLLAKRLEASGAHGTLDAASP